MEQSSLFGLSWRRYLNLLFLLLSAGFLTSGIVTLIAANLDYLSDAAKIYGLQALLLISVLLGGYFLMRERRKLPKEKLKLLSATFFFITAVLIGALFALVGQIYQTGANAWELFALWSICQLPLLLLLPNVASALLLIATANLSLYLCYDGRYGDNLFNYVVLLNTAFLLLSETFTRRLHDQHWRILPKILVFLVLGHLFGVNVITRGLSLEHASGFYFFIVFLQVALPAACFIYVYKQWRFDFVNLITASICTIIAFGIFLFSNVNSADFAVLAGLFLFVVTIFAIVLLHGWYKAHYPQRKSISWALSVLLIFAIFIGVVTGLIWIVLALNISEPKTSLLVLSVIVLFIALGMHFGNLDAETPVAIIVGIFFLMGYCLLAGYFLSDALDSYGDGKITCSTPMSFTAVIALFYFLRKDIWLRTLTIVIVLTMWHIYFTDCAMVRLNYTFRLEQRYVPLYFVTMLGCVAAFFVQKIYAENGKLHAQITPFAWAFLLFGIGGWLFSADNFFSPLFGHVNETVNALPQIDSAAEFFNLITAGFFSRAGFAPGWLVRFLVCLTPLIGYAVINRFFTPAKDEKILIVCVLTLFTLGFVAQPSVLFFAALLLLAYFMAHRTLFFIAVSFLLLNLALYYYLLFIPLLYKAFLLLLFALLFTATAYFLHRKTQSDNKSAVGFSGVFSGKAQVRPMIALGLVLLILLPLNYKIRQFEDVLATGKSVILKIAPVDPRSLMQGDYMALNYAILTDIRAQLNKSVRDEAAGDTVADKPRPRKVYALIHQDELTPAALCRIEETEPTDFHDCSAGVYLPVNTSGWLPALPSQSYFFAEGKGAYYAQAEYAEYRFKDGILLLARLLDKDLKAL